MSLRIFETDEGHEAVPKGYNAVRVMLEGKMRSTLDWTEAKREADSYLAQGLKIFWEIDLGIPNELQFSLDHHAQFQSLKLALDHFCDSIWDEYSENTVGLCLYRGEANLGPIAEYLDLLAAGLPEELMVVALLDATLIQGSATLAEIFVKEQCPSITFAVKGSSLLLQELGWGAVMGPLGGIGRDLLEKETPSVASTGILIPTTHPSDRSVQQALDALLTKQHPFRVISESRLISEWDGLDELIVIRELICPQTERGLQGFSAAGGKVTYVA